jgi:hypothetical protein
MKICLVHNEYGKFSDEEAVVAQQRDLLQADGHTVEMFTRTSDDISETLLAKTRALFSGIYSPSSRRAFRRIEETFRHKLVLSPYCLKRLLSLYGLGRAFSNLALSQIAPTSGPYS